MTGGYESDIERWIRECQNRNNPQPLPQAPLGTISASYSFEKISWDIMGLSQKEVINIFW